MSALTRSLAVLAKGSKGQRLLPRLVAAGALVANVLIAAGGVTTLALADPTSPITVTSVDSPDPVASGAQLTYTITITNTGGSKVDSLVFSDQVNGVGGIGVPPQLVLT